MRYIITLVIIILCSLHTSIAQGDYFYIVNDPDGWVNVRDHNKNISDKLINNDLVVVFGDQEEEGYDWLEVQYRRGDSIEYGYIHKSRLKSLNKLEKIPTIKETKNSICFNNGNIHIEINTESFSLQGRKLKYSDEGAWLEYIDDKYIWGVDGGLPKTQYQSITITHNNKKIVLPKSALSNLFEPSIEEDYTDVYYNPKNNTLYITALNSDGAGGYLVGWIIENGKYKERLVTHGF